MRKNIIAMAVALWVVTLSGNAQEKKGGASELTPSKSEYFSWINNTNEGSTEEQTRINLDFFRWLHDRYGMVLDIYAFDAGAIDGSKMYDNTSSARFRGKFPHGFGPLSQQAAAMGTRLGLWCGPDGFGETAEEGKARKEMMVGLARDYGFGLFKMDAVCGQLLPEKYQIFDEMMTEVRQYVPDFVLLNHRLDLGPGMKHTTTYLLGGKETYIDVHMMNTTTATHHRQGAMSRDNTAGLTRLTEDHGVCLSSCLDYWEDDLILQAFGRELVLAPEIYGNPWLLKDSEYAKLAFIFNLHRDYRDILPEAKALDEKAYGPNALSRGDANTRFLVLRNLTWNPVTYNVNIGDEVGLENNGKRVKARLYHPYIEDMGYHQYGSEMKVTVLPFRAALVKLTNIPEKDRISLSGIPYEIVNDRAGNVVEVNLLGMPGKTYNVTMENGKGLFASANIDGKTLNNLVKGKRVKVTFGGTALTEDYHRLIGKMEETDVPDFAESLYYATCYTATNNALEVRELERSGETAIPQVKAARDAFFNQKVFVDREIWDKNLFDDDPKTAYSVGLRWWDNRVNGKSALLLDFGEPISLDKLVFSTFDEYSLTPLATDEGIDVAISNDLVHWKSFKTLASLNTTLDLSDKGTIRYLRFPNSPLRLSEVTGYRNGVKVDRSQWRLNNLFREYKTNGATATQAWKKTFTLPEAARGAYLCVAFNG